MSAFDVLNAIFDKDEKFKYKSNDLPPYIISLWFSHAKDFLEIVNRINEFQYSLSSDQIFKYYFYKIPKGRRYIRWTKKNSVLNDEQKESIEELRKILGISKMEMMKYNSIIEKTVRENGRGKGK
jgi:hypothetical protein